MSMNFNDVLETKLDDIERPPLLPVGTYEWVISKIPSLDTSEDGNWDIVNFPLKCVRATDDVDQEALQNFGNPVGAFQNHSFVFNKNDSQAFDQTKFRLKRFLEEHVKVEAGLPMKQALNASVNKRILGTVTWKQDKVDQELYHANISQTAPVD
jgi:hypothetical protein